MSLERRRASRIGDSHQIARAAFRMAGGFALVAVVWSLIVLIRGGSWWGPLHAFVAGSVLLAISGTTQLFTITWSASAAAPAPIPAVQRWSTAAGVGSVLAGVTLDLVWLVLLGATSLLVGMGLLAASLISSVRHSLLRRFDLSARFYLLALGCGFVGITLGATMGAGVTGGLFTRIRLIHSHLNLVGLVGFTIVGTLPTILPTFAHHRVVSGKEAVVGWWVSVAAAICLVAGLLAPMMAGLGTIGAGAAALLMIGGILVRLGRRGLEGGLSYLQVSVGTSWLIVWAFVDGAEVVSGTGPATFAPWTAAAVMGGVGQILLGSLAYLMPVLAGPHPRLGPNIKRMTAHPWLPLALANGSTVALLTDRATIAAIGFGLWSLDFGRRALTLDRRQLQTSTSVE